MAFSDSVKNFRSAFTSPLPEQASKLMGPGDRLLRHTLEAESGFGKVFGLAGDVLKAPFRLVSMGSGAVTKATFGASTWTAGKVATGVGAVAVKPVEAVLHVSAAAVRGVRRHPVLAGGAALIGLGGYAISRADSDAVKRTQEALMGQMMAAQQAPQYPVYQTSPEDYMAMQARMRDSMADGTPVGNMAEKVRPSSIAPEAVAAAQDASTKPTANLAAL